MFRSDFSEKLFLENFTRLVNALEKLTNRQDVPEQRKATFEDIRAQLRAGNKINAIKLFRELTNASLKDA